MAEALATRVAERLDDAVVAPVLAIGASGEHRGFPGTLSIGSEVLARVVVELVRSARESFRAVAVVNAHGGNAPGLEAAAKQARSDGDALSVHHLSVPGGDAHAGRTETSMLLALAPSLVRKDVAMAGPTQQIAELMDALREGGVKAVSPNGVLGDPAGASAEEGEAILEAAVEQLVAEIEAALR